MAKDVTSSGLEITASPQTIKVGDNLADVTKYPRGVPTGSSTITCEVEGNIYVAAVKRGDSLTQVGTSMRLSYADGSEHPNGPADADSKATFIRHARELFGDEIGDLVAGGRTELLFVRDMVKEGPYNNARVPRPGDFPQGTRQIGMDYGTHLGELERLPELGASATWVNVKDLEMVREGVRTFYIYTGDDLPILGRGSEFLSNGGMHMVEEQVKRVRDLPYRTVGFDGMKGFLTLQTGPLFRNQDVIMVTAEAKRTGYMVDDGTLLTQMGKKPSEISDKVGKALEELNKSAATSYPPQFRKR